MLGALYSLQETRFCVEENVPMGTDSQQLKFLNQGANMSEKLNQPSKRKCDACGKEIEGGYFSNLGENRKDYHVHCKPQYFYIFEKGIPPYPRKEK